MSATATSVGAHCRATTDGRTVVDVGREAVTVTIVPVGDATRIDVAATAPTTDATFGRVVSALYGAIRTEDPGCRQGRARSAV